MYGKCVVYEDDGSNVAAIDYRLVGATEHYTANFVNQIDSRNWPRRSNWVLVYVYGNACVFSYFLAFGAIL